jgi:hypothetical protein
LVAWKVKNFNLRDLQNDHDFLGLKPGKEVIAQYGNRMVNVVTTA